MGGLLLALVGAGGAAWSSAGLDDLEQDAPARLAPAGGALTRFLPGLVANPSRGAAAATDPALGRAYASGRRRLQLFTALAGVGVALALFGLAPSGRLFRAPAEGTGTRGTAFQTDAAALLLLAACAYAVLALLEPG